MSILSELARRNVIRVAIGYAVASWVVLQIVDVVTPILGLPEWAPKLVFVLLAIGFVAALVTAWVYELTPEGLRRDADVHPDASIRHDTGRRLNYVIVAMLAAALQVVDEKAGSLPQAFVDRLRAEFAEAGPKADAEDVHLTAEGRKLRAAALAAQRHALIVEWRANQISDEVLHHLEEELDYREARL